MNPIQLARSALSGRSEFAANVATISAGSVAKTAIVLLALPIVTRIYAADDLGSLQLFASVLSIFIAVGTFKYEMAIVLPRDPEESNQLAVLCVGLAAAFAVALGGVAAVAGPPFLSYFNASQLEPWIALIPLGVFLGLVFAVSRYTLIAAKKFGRLASSEIAQVTTNQVLSIAYGLLRAEFLGLILGRLVGMAVGTALSLASAPIRFASVTSQQLRRIAYEYRKFPMVNTVGVFANNLALEIPVFVLARFFGAEIVGFYMLTIRILAQPMVLVGQAVQRVFLQSAAEARHRSGAELLALYRATVRNLALLGLVPAAVVWLLAPAAVEWILGPEWREVGVYMQILMIASYFELMMTPVSTAFSIVNRQEIGVVLMIVSAFVRLGAMLAFADSARSALLAFAIATALTRVVYLVAIDRVLSRVDAPA